MKSILVADVDTWSVEAVARAADRAGLKVLVAGNGIEALERFRSESPRLVIVDRLLGVLDGVQVCTKLRESMLGKASALFLSGSLDGDAARTLRERAQLSDVLPKPFTADDVFRVIQPFLLGPDSAAHGPESELPEAGSFELKTSPLTRVFVDLVAQKRSGELLWTDGHLVKSVYLDHGVLVGGRSNGRQDLWPAWAARDPLLGAEQRMRLSALAVPGPGAEGWEPYLDAKGILRPPEFRASRSRWLLSLTLDLLAQRSGRGAFVENARPPEALGAFDGQSLAVLALREATGECFDALLPSPLSLVRRTGAPGPRSEDQGLTQVEQELLGLADGTRTLGELLALGRLIQHDVRPFVYGMLNLGVLETLAKDGERSVVATVSRMPDEIGSTGIRRSGDLGEAPLARVLGTISASGATGILQMRRGPVQLSIHVQSGRIVFACSNQVEHRLGNVLLGAGKISPDDHARALTLQSVQRSRRLGAILLAAGALSLKELHEGLCTQVRTILLEGFRWVDGVYAFMEGALPSDDMVSLDVSTPNLILECLRSLELDPRMIRGMPDDGAVLVRLWDPERIQALLRPVAVEEAVLQGAAHGIRLRDVFRLRQFGKDDVVKAVYALMGIGCIEASTARSPADREETHELKRPETKPAAALVTRPGNSEATDAMIDGLRDRILVLEAENRRLRGLLTANETVHVSLH